VDLLQFLPQEPAKRNVVPFACTGDFDGNGLMDAALLLRKQRGPCRLVALPIRTDRRLRIVTSLPVPITLDPREHHGDGRHLAPLGDEAEYDAIPFAVFGKA
jgi:hypothetical protein